MLGKPLIGLSLLLVGTLSAKQKSDYPCFDQVKEQIKEFERISEQGNIQAFGSAKAAQGATQSASQTSAMSETVKQQSGMTSANAAQAAQTYASCSAAASKSAEYLNKQCPRQTKCQESAAAAAQCEQIGKQLYGRIRSSWEYCNRSAQEAQALAASAAQNTGAIDQATNGGGSGMMPLLALSALPLLSNLFGGDDGGSSSTDGYIPPTSSLPPGVGGGSGGFGSDLGGPGNSDYLNSFATLAGANAPGNQDLTGEDAGLGETQEPDAGQGFSTAIPQELADVGPANADEEKEGDKKKALAGGVPLIGQMESQLIEESVGSGSGMGDEGVSSGAGRRALSSIGDEQGKAAGFKAFDFDFDDKKKKKEEQAGNLDQSCFTKDCIRSAKKATQPKLYSNKKRIDRAAQKRKREALLKSCEQREWSGFHCQQIKNDPLLQ